MQLFDLADVAATEVREVVLVDKPLEQKITAAVAAVKAAVLSGMYLVVAWSGGKDSSVTLNIAFTAWRELAAAGLPLPTLHVMHSDTRLENPVVHAYNQGQLRQIERYAAAAGIPVKVWVASPGLSNDYLVSLIGGRIIASVGSNAKCQQKCLQAIFYGK